MADSGERFVLPPGHHDARMGLLIMAVMGEILQGGLFFGWNALAIMIKDLDNFTQDCPPPDPLAGFTLCKSQESKLALIWTIGIFSLNCGPVVMGFLLDYLGPKFAGIFGVFLNMLALLLFGVSSSPGTNAFIPAAIIMGLGNIAFHLAQFHISALFPRKRGLVSSLFVAGFTGSGIIMYLLLLIFQIGGSTRNAYRGVLLGYAGVCALWVPLLAWMMPNDSFRVGSIYMMRPNGRFEVKQRSELGRQYRRGTMLQDFVAAASQAGGTDGAVAGTAAYMYGQDRVPAPEHAGTGLVGDAPSSSDPAWSSMDAAEEQRRQRQRQQQRQWGRSPKPAAAAVAAAAAGTSSPSPPPRPPPSPSPPAHSNGVAAPRDVEAPSSPPDGAGVGVDGTAAGPESMPLPPDVVWGPLVFEARRFVELRKKSFRQQLASSESFGMGVFYTLNVFMMQFYLGTQRLQLDYKGDSSQFYSNFGNVVVAFAFLAVPFIGWLLDKKGYGWTLGTINALGVLTSLLQALPPLWLQTITLIIWMLARFFMYSSYFAIFGGLFGYANFGRLVAVDNTVNGLFGLLQYPLTYLAIHKFDGNFTWINVGQVVVGLPLFSFCYFMYRSEREDLVPIRPLEGEELPCDMVGQRTRKALPHVHLPSLPHIELPTRIPGFGGGRS